MAVSRAWRVRALAKVNISLRVVGVRPDGYHELRTIFQSIALHDTIEIRRRPGPLALHCDDPACPSGASNLVWRAAAAVWRASGQRGAPEGVELVLTKRIPMEAGLGGGSSDAVAAIRALGALWGVDTNRQRDIAVSLGADLLYFFEGGAVLGLDRGDRLFPLAEAPVRHVVLVKPGFGVSTRDAFGWWDRAAEGRGPAWQAPRGHHTLGPDTGNDLERFVARHHPEIRRIAVALQKAGACYAGMSGSGSVVFGLFDTRAHADAARARVEGRGRRAWLSRTVNRAAYRRLAAIPGGRIHLPFALRRLGPS
jgi:4-diphosphocytidyl-2-C-methyl-D-erythritol kinase